MGSADMGFLVLGAGAAAVVVWWTVVRVGAWVIRGWARVVERRALAAEITTYQAAAVIGAPALASAGARVLIRQGLLHISRFGVAVPAVPGDGTTAKPDALGVELLALLRWNAGFRNPRLADVVDAIAFRYRVEPARLGIGRWQAMRLDSLRARLERLGRVGGVVAAWTVLACLIAAVVLLAGLWKEHVLSAGGWDEAVIAVAFTAVGVPVGIGYAVGWAHAAGPYVVGRRPIHAERLRARCRDLVAEALDPHDDEDVRRAVELSCTRSDPPSLVHPRRTAPRAGGTHARDDDGGCGADGGCGCGCGE